MKRKLVILVVMTLVMALVGCGGAPVAPPVGSVSSSSSAGDEQPQPPAPSNAPSTMSGNPNRLLSIRAVGLGPDGYVAFENFTDVPVSLTGTHLCQGSTCAALPDAVIEAGEIGIVALGSGSGLDNVVASSVNVGELRPSDGEIALFASDTVSAAELLNYLEWGSTPHELTGMAIEAGLWHEGSYAPTSATATRLYRIVESGLWVFDAP